MEEGEKRGIHWTLVLTFAIIGSQMRQGEKKYQSFHS